jgi:glutamyl-tRNA synthetase
VAGQPARGAYGPYRQSQRGDLYAAAIARLLEEDRAYPCYCTAEELAADRHAQQAARQDPAYVGRCAGLTVAEREARRADGRPAVVRFRIGEGRVEFDDLVRGHVGIETGALGGDLVIARSDGSPLYHFVVVVDDIAMRISHVIRGEDHLSNTPKHVLLFRALGADPPTFAHLPLILNPDRSKMSKRKSQTAIDAYREQGYIREAIVNHLALLGWSSGSDEEVFGLDQLVERFDLGRVQPSGAIFDIGRLDWLNGQWIRRLAADDLVDRALPFLAAAVEAEAARGHTTRTPTADDLAVLLPMVVERLPRLDAIGPMLDSAFTEDVSGRPQLLPKRWDATTTHAGLTEARRVIGSVGAISFEADELEPPLRALCEERGWKVGDLFMAIRVAITGRTASPPLFDTMVAIGYERTLRRLDAARAVLSDTKEGPSDASDA